jgi:4'-phosphopantetheinyl transferase
VDGPSFNLSHSGSTVLLGIAESGDLGVDVEAVRKIADVDGLAHRCFSVREIEALAACTANEKLRAFFRAWTRKEAFLKALGTGLRIDPRSFSVSLDSRIGNALLDGKACCGDSDSWTVLPVRLPGAFEAAVAWNRPNLSLQVQEFDLNFSES